MIKHFYFQLFLLLCITPLTSVAEASNKADLEQQIKKIITDEDLVGIVWSTVSKDSVNIGSAGFSNKSENILMSDSQKMHVGSVTKTVLAIGILRLITEGKLALATNVEYLLPEIAFNNPWKETAPITVKNLLDHTAGLDNIRMWQFLNSTPTPDMPLSNAFPSDNLKLLRVRTKPGTQYSYSNMGYALLAMVIEAVTKERYENYLDKNLLQPLGMLNSTFQFITQTGPNKDAALALGYYENSVSQTALPMYLRPAGQFTTTAPDMAKFMQFLLNDGVLINSAIIDSAINEKVFIRLDLMNLLSYPNQTNAEKAGLNIGHGLALAVRDRHEVVARCHPGTTFGFQAYICLFPLEKKAFFYSINTDNETANYEKFNSAFINHLSIKKASIAQASLTQATEQLMDLSKLEGIYLPAPNNMAEFEFLDLLFNFKWLTRQDDKILMQTLQSADRVLIPVSANLFRATDRTQTSHAVIIDENDDIYISNGLSTYKQQSALLLIGYWLSLLLGLFGLLYIVLVGIYRLVTKKTENRNFVLLPLLNILALAVPIYLFMNQPFIIFGEQTLASLSLAVITGLLPITLLLPLFYIFRKKLNSKWAIWDCSALIMLMQLCLVLIYWDVFPAIFWQ
jgi:CubicO group peptidase (beta-lactamase class C family)